MSMHKSLRSSGHLERQRNVLTRRERIEKLMEMEEWEEGDSVFGLPTVKESTSVAPVTDIGDEGEADNEEQVEEDSEAVTGETAGE